MSIRNVGIFAHVDAGKTTLSEQLLLRCGAIRQAGSVDRGTAHTDRLPVERRRGISVKATCVQLKWKDTEINLIDTPGHADFSAEIERSLWALDGAVLVINAAAGVQPQTGLLFSALRAQSIPVILFLNKMDREGVNLPELLHSLGRLSPNAARPEDTGSLLDIVSGLDDEVMERFLEDGSVPDSLLRERFKKLAKAGLAFPVLTGSALQGQGVEELLDAIAAYLPAPQTVSDELCGIVFASEQVSGTPGQGAEARASSLGRGVYVRLYGGSLVNRQAIELPAAGNSPLAEGPSFVQQKISQIRNADGEDVGSLSAGQIGIIYGLGGVRVGQVLGRSDLIPRSVQSGLLAVPLLTVRVMPEDPSRLDELRSALTGLSLEDPLLGVIYARNVGELHLTVMGKIQLEILSDTLATRFGLPVQFGRPTVIYRETIASEAVGTAIYTMPKPCWAILHFQIRPAQRGSGVHYHSEVSFRDIPERYQHQVEQALPIALAQGRLGWPVTDVDITLKAGGYHHIHTHPLDFIVATPWAIQDGLQKGGSTLLEPILAVTFSLPQDNVGRVMSDVTAMRGEVTNTQSDGDRSVLEALIPAAECLDYSETLSALSGGWGSMAARLSGYRECPLSAGHTIPRRSVDPLDTSKYILAARSALEGGIFDA